MQNRTESNLSEVDKLVYNPSVKLTKPHADIHRSQNIILSSSLVCDRTFFPLLQISKQTETNMHCEKSKCHEP